MQSLFQTGNKSRYGSDDYGSEDAEYYAEALFDGCPVGDDGHVPVDCTLELKMSAAI
jgi:hypothetical protein